MKMKSENGFTVIDIATAIVVLFIFISLISFLSYNFNSTNKEIELKATACEIAVEQIEKMKSKTLEELESENTDYRKQQEIETGYTREIIVQDYNDINPEKQAGIVKKVTVRIQYKHKKQIQTIELSTIISKES